MDTTGWYHFVRSAKESCVGHLGRRFRYWRPCRSHCCFLPPPASEMEQRRQWQPRRPKRGNRATDARGQLPPPLFWILSGLWGTPWGFQNILWAGCSSQLLFNGGQLDICIASPMVNISPFLSLSHLLPAVTLANELLWHQPLLCGNPRSAFAFRETESTLGGTQANSEPA